MERISQKGEGRMARCVHQWEIVDKTVLPSPYEQMVAGNRVLERVKGMTEGVIQALFQKIVVLVQKCPKCGRLSIIRTRLFK